MSSTQDAVLSIAKELGTFTTSEMARIYSGRVDPEGRSRVWAHLNNLVKYGHIKKLGRQARTESHQREMVWRYIA